MAGEFTGRKGSEVVAETKERKVGFFKGVRGEFSKIVWPNREVLAKNTFTVIVITGIIGGAVAAIDFGFNQLIFTLIEKL